MIDPDLYSVAQCERFSPAGAKNICRVSNFNYFSIKSGKKKKADITQRVGFLISDIVHSCGCCANMEKAPDLFICCNLVRLQTAVLQKLLRAVALTWWRRPPAWRGFTAENNINSHPRSARRIK